jgi:hypothetical protein
MSRNRYARLPPIRRDKDGHLLCRWCRKRVPKGRRYWCSRKCVNEYLLLSSRQLMDSKVLKRDRGMCSICGLDCIAVEEALDELRDKCHMALLAGQWPDWQKGTLWDFRNSLGLRNRRRCWDADHIKPVCRGGGECGLENYRTLCVWCHRRETARLRKELAKERRLKS